jgi:lipoprotein-anchoring transpeptidase ErfK/SrfK
MSRRGPLVAALVVAAGAAPSAAAQEETIPPGVTVGGVAVGGLSVDAARARIDLAIARSLRRRLVVRAGRRRFSLMPRAAGATVDPGRLAQTALRVGRAQPPGPDGTAPVDVPVRVPVRPAAVRALVARVRAGLWVAPVNSELRFSLRRVWASRSRPGRRLARRSALARQVTATLRSWTAPRLLGARTVRVRPYMTPRRLRARTGPVLTVSRHERRVRLFTHLRLRKVYRVAVGQPAFPTPTGLFHVYAKQVNPAWSVPHSTWAGNLGGQVIPGGSAANPLKARWIGFAPGVGFHGTADLGSIGGAQSHGCVRMRVADVEDLYRRVPIGTPVYVR